MLSVYGDTRFDSSRIDFVCAFARGEQLIYWRRQCMGPHSSIVQLRVVISLFIGVVSAWGHTGRLHVQRLSVPFVAGGECWIRWCSQ